jgi:glyoxylase-like metal-dependent hydrolase (beta-lactamase superfamily II)
MFRTSILKVSRVLAATAVLSVGALSPSVYGQQETSAPVPSVYRFMVGDVRVTSLSDGTVALDLHRILRGTSPSHTDSLLRRSFLNNPYEASINVFLIELGARRVLVDTGAGELFGPGNGGKLVAALAATGVHPAQIDDVLITHVHSDHIGGLVVGGKMQFPNATVHVGKPDVDFFLDPGNAERTGMARRFFAEAEATLKPYVDAGKVKTFDRRSEVIEGIVAELRPGHTPGTAFYTLTSRGRRLVFIGDTIHVGAVQFPAPDITITFDQNQPKARAVRTAAFAQFARDGMTIAAPHVSFPGVGRLRPEGSGYRWVPLEYTDPERRP